MNKEVTRVVGNRPLQLSDLKDLPLVKASLKETLRLYPAPFVISRIMQRDTNVRGYNVPAGVSPYLQVNSRNLERVNFAGGSSHQPLGHRT